MSLEAKFCPNCNNILDITKNPSRNNNYQQQLELADNTPNTVSESDAADSANSADDVGIVDEIDEANNEIENIINNIVSSIEFDDVIIGNHKLEQFTKNKEFTKLDKKTKSAVQSKLISFFEKLDDAVSAFFVCSTCGYSKSIEAGTLISRRASSDATNTYVNFDRLKNKLNSKVLPHTRDYICINDSCPSHKDHSKRDAVMYRLGTKNAQIWYTCSACEQYWKGE
jgi:DNA-directed RNA polymerase subunit M/transcription elongation factor TFIIS